MRKQKTREDKLLSNSHTASRMIVEETLPWADQTNSFYLLDQWLANCSSLTKSSLNVKWKWKSPGSVQSLSRVWLFATSWITARQASPSITAFQISLKLTSIESVMPSSHLILCHPFLLLPSIFPSIRVGCWVKWVSSFHQVTKVLEFQLQHQSFQWIFRNDLH